MQFVPSEKKKVWKTPNLNGATESTQCRKPVGLFVFEYNRTPKTKGLYLGRLGRLYFRDEVQRKLGLTNLQKRISEDLTEIAPETRKTR